MRIRDQIIEKSRVESEKNVTVFYEDIAKVEFRNSHAKVFIEGRYDFGVDGEAESNVPIANPQDESLQPVHLINGDRVKYPHLIQQNYGVLVLSMSPGRYSEAIGILVRKDTFSETLNEASDRLIGGSL